MLLGNQLGQKIVEKGLAKKIPPTKQKKKKQFNCIKCGEPMIRIDDTNVMACSSCKNWFIFDKN